MIDIKLIRKDPQRYKDAAEVKGFEVDINKLLRLDRQITFVQTQLNELKYVKKGLEAKLLELKPLFNEIMLKVPQPPDGLPHTIVEEHGTLHRIPYDNNTQRQKIQACKQERQESRHVRDKGGSYKV